MATRKFLVFVVIFDEIVLLYSASFSPEGLQKKKNLIVTIASQNGSGDDVHNLNRTPRRRIDLREFLDVYFHSVLLPRHHWGLHFQEICLIANCI